jgi:putative thioredoxin
MEVTSPYINDVTTAEFQQEVLSKSRDVPVLVDFWAEWCGPCKALSPLLERMTEDASGKFLLAKVDVDANPELSAQFGIQSIPTVVAIVNGNEVNRFSGVSPEATILTFIDSVMPSDIDLMVEEARSMLISGDTAAAEHILRQALGMQSDHQDAGTSLAALLIDQGDTEDAMIVLGKLVPDAEVDRLQGAARLRRAAGTDISILEAAVKADPEDGSAQLELARALAARDEYEPALDRLLTIVRNGSEYKEDARLAMVDIFGVIGAEHPLTSSYRRQLASALY